MAPGVLVEVARVAGEGGVDLEGLCLAWARSAPVVILVPAFGLRALPVAARAVVALALAAGLAPAMHATGVPVAAPASLWPAHLLASAVAGLPVAIAAAVPLWAATMAGGVMDALRGASDAAFAPTVEGRATPLGVPLSLLACALFFATGGAARVVDALAAPDVTGVAAIAATVASGIALAIALAGPVLAAAVVIEVGGALVARAAAPAPLGAVILPARALALLAVVGVSFERLATLLALAQMGSR